MSRFDDVICATPKPFAQPLTPLRNEGLFAAQQNDDSAASAGMSWRFAVREHVVDAREPSPHFALQHGFAVW